MDDLHDIFLEIRDERAHQEQLRREGKFSYTCADPNYDAVFKLPILAEEFGEVARAVCEELPGNAEKDRTNLRKELVQLTAVAVAWLESI